MDGLVTRVRRVKTETGRHLDIPPGFLLGGDEVPLRQDGERLVLEPVVGRQSLRSVLGGLADLDATWPEIADPKPEDGRL